MQSLNFLFNFWNDLCIMYLLFSALFLLSAFTGGCAVTTVPFNHPQTATVRLCKARRYETVEAFSRTLSSVAGVDDVMRVSSLINREEPQKSLSVWSVALTDMPIHVLERNIMDNLKLVTASGGKTRINGMEYNYSASEIDLLKGIFPEGATGSVVTFTVDRERARDREFGGLYGPRP